LIGIGEGRIDEEFPIDRSKEKHFPFGVAIRLLTLLSLLLLFLNWMAVELGL